MEALLESERNKKKLTLYISHAIGDESNIFAMWHIFLVVASLDHPLLNYALLDYILSHYVLLCYILYCCIMHCWFMYCHIMHWRIMYCYIMYCYIMDCWSMHRLIMYYWIVTFRLYVIVLCIVGLWIEWLCPNWLVWFGYVLFTYWQSVIIYDHCIIRQLMDILRFMWFYCYIHILRRLIDSNTPSNV